MLTDNDDVSYVENEYDKYKCPEQTRNDGYELKPYSWCGRASYAKI